MSNFNSFARELESIAKEGFHNLEKAQDELDQAQAELEKLVGQRTRSIQRALENVDKLHEDPAHEEQK